MLARVRRGDGQASCVPTSRQRQHAEGLSYRSAAPAGRRSTPEHAHSSTESPHEDRAAASRPAPRQPHRRPTARPSRPAPARRAAIGGRRDASAQAGRRGRPARRAGLGGRARASHSRVGSSVRRRATRDPHRPRRACPRRRARATGLFELVPTVARRALELGLSAREPSFHVFVAAEPEVMIEDDIVRYATRFAEHASHAARHRLRPRLRPPRGAAAAPLAGRAGPGARGRDGRRSSSGCRSEIPAVVEGDEFKRAQAQLAAELEAKNRAVIHQLESLAKTLGFGVRAGARRRADVPDPPRQAGERRAVRRARRLDQARARPTPRSKLTREVEKAAQLVRAQSARLRGGARGGVLEGGGGDHRRGDRRTSSASFAPLGDRRARTGSSACSEALVEDWDDLVEIDDEDEQEKRSRDDKDDPELATRLNRFSVNLLVSHEPGAPAPVVYDTNPTYPSLFGYLERRARFGALLTDFTRIRAGSLHKASGGVLVVRAADLLTDPIIWERMKRVLREQRIGAEDPLGPLGLYATSLRPVPVPIRVRVVLVGSPELYATLLEADPDFASLFRVKVEVDPIIPRTPREPRRARRLPDGDGARSATWGRFDRGARAQLLDLATRLAGDREKLALILSPLEETMAFASALAAARATRRRRGRETPAPTTESERARPSARRSRRRRCSVVTRRGHPGRRGSSGASARGAPSGTSARSRSAARSRSTRRARASASSTGCRVFSAGDVEFGQPMRITAVVGIGREGHHRRRARGAARRQHPHEGRRHPARLPRAHVRAGAPAQPARAARVRAELRRDRRRQRELERALRGAQRARRRGDRPGDRRDRKREPARRDAGHRRRVREDRGLLRPLRGARA